MLLVQRSCTAFSTVQACNCTHERIGQQPSSSQDHMRASFDGVATFFSKSTGAHLLEREEDFGGGLVAA